MYDTFITVVQTLISLSLLMGMGYAAGKTGIINEVRSAGLADILIKVALPCVVITSMKEPFSAELARGGVTVFVASTVIYGLSMAAGMLLSRLLRVKITDAGVWIFAATFSNLGYMGIPVMQSVFKDNSTIMFYTMIYNASFNIYSTTVGIAAMRNGAKFWRKTEGDKVKKDINLLPIFTLIGLALFLFSLDLPGPVDTALKTGGSLTTPLSMIIIGGMFARNDLRKVVTVGRGYILIALRLLVLPVIVFFIASPIISDKDVLAVLVLLTAMPVAAVTAIFAAKYKANSDLASRFVVLSTVLSVATIPVISLLLG